MVKPALKSWNNHQDATRIRELEEALADLLDICKYIGKFENGVKNYEETLDEGEYLATKAMNKAEAVLRTIALTKSALPQKEDELKLLDYVFRMQDKDGRGPFKPGFSKEWIDEYLTDGMKPLPTFYEEFGMDVIRQMGDRNQWYGSAVEKHRDINKWFSKTEQDRLKNLGYRIMCMRPTRILAKSKNQLLIARDKPFYVDSFPLEEQAQ